ncbi:hypothetical protein KTT_56150 [Tengunoibacter tsumagoiensis]|uniref:Uncharacterized protein n=1 Tax=Tengunoibacter tsumagoiensis TaxID=2014871 RepID=A0A402A9S0_9CHLR|nr:hypothetical protein KTT_56150 [Tengunoibacter tsumagoiensis]
MASMREAVPLRTFSQRHIAPQGIRTHHPLFDPLGRRSALLPFLLLHYVLFEDHIPPVPTS